MGLKGKLKKIPPQGLKTKDRNDMAGKSNGKVPKTPSAK
jgi:hypothetical protein